MEAQGLLGRRGWGGGRKGWVPKIVRGDNNQSGLYICRNCLGTNLIEVIFLKKERKPPYKYLAALLLSQCPESWDDNCEPPHQTQTPKTNPQGHS